MRKKVISGFMVLGCLVLGSSANSMTTIDEYYGGGETSRGINPENDLVGDAAYYDVSKMEVNITSSQVTVDIYSRWFNNIGQGPSGADHTEIGDFFISTDDWTPFGSAASFYDTDVASNGEVWEYALVFDDADRDGSSSKGDLSLYSVEAQNIINASYSRTPSGYRPGQEILYETSQDTAVAGFTGGWELFFAPDGSVINPNLTDTDDFLRLTFDNTTLGLDIDEFAFRWTMTCANDIIEGGSSEVPEPATLLLFGAGMAGFAGRKWNRRKK